MIRRLVVATRNRGKLAELTELLADLPVEVLSLEAFPGAPEPEEPHATFAGNAAHKARLTAAALGEWVLADDSGLQVWALDGAPGVRSSRLAGSDPERIARVLARLGAAPPSARGARFVCALALASPQGVVGQWEGAVEGRLTDAPRGEEGFGFDPVFLYPPAGMTFAEMTRAQKSAVSHRGRALRAFVGDFREMVSDTAKTDPPQACPEGLVPLVHVTRGPIVESVHYGALAVCHADGNVLMARGDIERPYYWRSSAKPVQALCVIQSGAADRFSFTAREIAICCASHHGSAEHVAAARRVLQKAGLDESALQCGTHWPGDTAERDRLIKADLQPTPLHNNCSGKHSGMLASTVALGADPATYLQLDQPVQQAILANMSALSGVPREDIIVAVDGCGAPVHGMGLRAMATAFARLCFPDDMPPAIQAAAPRIIAAMAAEPEMISGRGDFNADLLAAYQGRLVAKSGAEGLMMVGLTDRGLGLAMRAIDGSHRGLPAAMMELLARLGATDDAVLEALAGYVRPQNRNCRDDVIGEIRPAF